MSFEAVIFDIGGVLEVNPRTGWQERWATRLDLDPHELQARLDPVWRRGDIGALTLPEVAQQTAQRLELTPDQLRAFMDDLWVEYLGTLNEEMARYFAALRPRYRTGIVSNSFVGAREREQAAYRFENMGDVIVYSHEVGIKKPDPRIYEIACRRLRTQPAGTIFLDDVPENVEGARRTGLTAIGFEDNAQAISELDALLDR